MHTNFFSSNEILLKVSIEKAREINNVPPNSSFKLNMLSYDFSTLITDLNVFCLFRTKNHCFFPRKHIACCHINFRLWKKIIAIQNLVCLLSSHLQNHQVRKLCIPLKVYHHCQTNKMSLKHSITKYT